VISGSNDGANIGDDTVYSATAGTPPKASRAASVAFSLASVGGEFFQPPAISLRAM
jgi:broad specificity polyphosphatase/5'/3'-nucleotidase SurE